MKSLADIDFLLGAYLTFSTILLQNKPDFYVERKPQLRVTGYRLDFFPKHVCHFPLHSFPYHTYIEIHLFDSIPIHFQEKNISDISHYIATKQERPS